MRLHAFIAALAAIPVLMGCATDDQDGPPADRPDSSVGHIHGLGVDPADGFLYVATHHGLFRVDGDSEPTRVADRWQDTMAFTITGPRRFLASGHPDVREDLPSQLGLIESTDAGQTWRPVALQGEADFHLLEQAQGILYAYDATSGELLATEDRKSFDPVVRAPLVSLAPDPDDPSSLLATTSRAELVSIDTEQGTVTAVSGPALAMIATHPSGALVGLDPHGAAHVRSQTDGDWVQLGEIGGAPAALLVTDERWFAATEDQVLESSDAGRTWTRVL